ncbi:MAG: hypothetical protein WA865_19550 [Spirulinaceae cyanobacterium]
MAVFLTIAGLLILTYITVDVLVTILTVGGGGPLTSRLSSGVWHLALRFHGGNRSRHRLLALTGSLISVAIVMLWFVATWVGWSLIFCAVDKAVVNAATEIPANNQDRIYFVGYTLSTLGMGNFKPLGFTWQMAAAIASANGFFLVTLALAYVLSVVAAVAQKYSTAMYISSLGGSAEEIIARAWNGKDFGQFDQHLIALSSIITSLGVKYLTFPVLHYFHSVESSRSMALSLASLDEALTLLQYGVAKSSRPDPIALETARRANAAFLKVLDSAYIEPASELPEFPALEPLKSNGIPVVSEREFAVAMQQLIKRRRLLLAFVQNDGWTWHEIASGAKSARSQELDDAILTEC